MAEKLVPVEFIQKYRMYTKGEIAGFSKSKAEALCEGKNPIARPFKSGKAVEK
jgi:hypothetical protein